MVDFSGAAVGTRRCGRGLFAPQWWRGTAGTHPVPDEPGDEGHDHDRGNADTELDAGVAEPFAPRSP